MLKKIFKGDLIIKIDDYEKYVEKMKDLKPYLNKDPNKEESIGLKAFEELKTVMLKLFGGVERCEKSLSIVEAELERLKRLDIMYSFCVIEGTKQKKALEIIRNKVVLIDVLIEVDNVNEYNEFVSKSKDRHLTQDEFNLLKEVLSWKQNLEK